MIRTTGRDRIVPCQPTAPDDRRVTRRFVFEHPGFDKAAAAYRAAFAARNPVRVRAARDHLNSLLDEVNRPTPEPVGNA